MSGWERFAGLTGLEGMNNTVLELRARLGCSLEGQWTQQRPRPSRTSGIDAASHLEVRMNGKEEVVPPQPLHGGHQPLAEEAVVGLWLEGP